MVIKSSAFARTHADSDEFGTHFGENNSSPILLPNSLTPPPLDLNSRKSAVSGHEFWLSQPYAAGDPVRLLTEYFGNMNFTNNFRLSMGASFSFFDQWGLSLVGVSGGWKIPFLSSEVTLGFQQERWPSWQMSENRAVLYWTLYPNSSVVISFGYSFRSPQYRANFIQSWNWPLDEAEFGLLYRIELRILQILNFNLSCLIFDYDRMRLYTYTNAHVTLQPQYQLTPNWKIQGLVGTAAQGVSGAVISWNENYFSLGISYEHP